MNWRRGLAAALVLGAIASVTGCATSTRGSNLPGRATAVRAAEDPRAASLAAPGVHHYEYALLDQAIFVYDIDHGHRLVQRLALQGVDGIRGVVASPRTHRLYVSHGADGGPGSTGSLLAYDLPTGTVKWNRSYSRGIDSMAISADGARIYLPDGELSKDGVWSVIAARTGNVIGSIDAGMGPHNTIVGLSGKLVYLGGRSSGYLDVASTATNRVIRRIGPLESGVRPFTINGRETLAFTTATGFLGFQESSITSGRVLHTVTFGPRFRFNPATFAPSAPSHGISLSPDERQLWVIDAPNSYVHVFDVSRAPRRSLRRIADIKLADPLTGGQSSCSYDCARDGWLQHSRSGCFVYVGDSGDVYSTRSFRRVAFLPALRNTRITLEIDWRNGLPVATTTRSGLGYVKRGAHPSRPNCR